MLFLLFLSLCGQHLIYHCRIEDCHGYKVINHVTMSTNITGGRAYEPHVKHDEITMHFIQFPEFHHQLSCIKSQNYLNTWVFLFTPFVLHLSFIYWPDVVSFFYFLIGRRGWKGSEALFSNSGDCSNNYPWVGKSRYLSEIEENTTTTTSPFRMVVTWDVILFFITECCIS